MLGVNSNQHLLSDLHYYTVKRFLLSYHRCQQLCICICIHKVLRTVSSFHGDYLQNHEFVVLLANAYAFSVLLGL